MSLNDDVLPTDKKLVWKDMNGALRTNRMKHSFDPPARTSMRIGSTMLLFFNTEAFPPPGFIGGPPK
jgi:hypothetical protein